MTQQTVKNKGEPLIEFRCDECGKLLAMVSKNASCSIKCGRCKKLNTFNKENAE